MTRFVDRRDAADQLLTQLDGFRGDDDVLVLALPRGGVPLGHRIAQALGAELDVVIVRKLGHPNFPELALGAIALGGVCVLNHDIVAATEVGAGELSETIQRETSELLRRERAYRGTRPVPRIRQRSVLVVDDGIATGATILAACQAIRRFHPRTLTLVAPVAPRQLLSRLRKAADEVVLSRAATDFRSVGEFYDSFEPVSDAEVQRLLLDAWRKPDPNSRAARHAAGGQTRK